MLRTEFLRTWRLVVFAAVAFMLAPFASAGIIGVASATGPCSSNGLSNGGGTICSGNTTPYSLTALLNGTQILRSDVGTQTAPVYLVNNDTGSTSFTLVFNGQLQSNQSINCQENGPFAGNSCTVSGALGKVGNSIQYGPPSPNGTLVATVTFTGVPAGNFDLTFASFSNGDSGTLTGSGTGNGAACGGPVTVSSDVMRQRLIYMAPVYPVTAPVGVSGTVVLNIVVDCTGKVISDTVASGSDPMASASVTAVNNWTYQPYLVNGTVVQVQTTVTLTFGQGKY
jgi:hypothetical protein